MAVPASTALDGPRGKLRADHRVGLAGAVLVPALGASDLEDLHALLPQVARQAGAERPRAPSIPTLSRLSRASAYLRSFA